MNRSKINLILILICLIGFVNSAVLVNSEIDKPELTINEVAFLKINLYNNDLDIQNYPIKIETSSNLVILENDQQIYVKNIENLNANIGKEVTIKIKALNTTKETGQIYVYYGSDLQYVSGTFVNTNESLISFITSAQKKIIDGEEKIIVNFDMKNNSKNPLYNIAIEAKAPVNFIVKDPIEVIPILYDGNSISKQIEILPPLGINGNQKIILAYGYFDENSPHYFEENFDVEFEKQNNMLLAGIGIIILIIAIFIYMNQKKDNGEKVKGTAEKAEDEQ